MKPVSIIANPASGKDIRRLVAHGSVFDNQEKVRIVRRLLLGMERSGVEEVLYMPDAFGIVERAIDGISTSIKAKPFSIYMHNTQEDTVNAARLAAERARQAAENAGREAEGLRVEFNTRKEEAEKRGHALLGTESPEEIAAVLPREILQSRSPTGYPDSLLPSTVLIPLL